MYNKTMAEPFDIERKISEIEAKLANLDHHRNQLLDELTQLRQLNIQKDSPAQLMLNIQGIKVNNQSSRGKDPVIPFFIQRAGGRIPTQVRKFQNRKVRLRPRLSQ